jgi:hypothetical protein
MSKSNKTRKKKPVSANEQQGVASKPVSLAPLDFEQALDGLLATDPKKVKESERKAEEERGRKRAGR